MRESRDMRLLELVVNTINSWDSGQTARIHRTNVLVDADTWRKPYSGYAQPASIVGSKVTYDPALCKHARTDRVYFVDVHSGIMAWGPRQYIQDRKGANTIDLSVARRFKSAPIKFIDGVKDTQQSVADNNDNVPIEKVVSRIWVTFQKEGIHKYPAALTDPKLATGDWDDVSFLGYPHRHTFMFRVEIDVFHDDRDIEFIQFKRWLERLYSDNILQLDYRSCEMISDDLAAKISEKYPGRKIVIEVSEDGENGSHSVYVPK